MFTLDQSQEELTMFKNEYQANVEGFSACANVLRKPPVLVVRARINLFKLAGYSLAILAIIAAVY